MNDLLKSKSMLISVSDCDYGTEIDFVAVVNEKDYAEAVNCIKQAKKDFYDAEYEGEYYKKLSDMVCDRLEEQKIEYLMPDFDGI